MRLRRETRERARVVQLLHAWELQRRPPLAKTAAALLRHLPRCRGAIEDAEALAAEILQSVDALDAEINGALEHWRPERVGLVERNILRVALHELQLGHVPPRVAINEAVRLAHWFGGGGTPAFVNGVLDAVARRAGQL